MPNPLPALLADQAAKLNDGQKRAIRTAYHALVAFATAVTTFVPVLIHLLAGTPYAAKAAVLGATAVAWAGTVAAAINWAEDNGYLPALLRAVGDNADVTPVAPAPDVTPTDAPSDPTPAPAADATTDASAPDPAP